MTALTADTALTFEEAVAICRAWNFGGRVKPCLHDTALAIVRERMPIAAYVPPAEFYEDDSAKWDADNDYKEWVQANEAYQEMLKS